MASFGAEGGSEAICVTSERAGALVATEEDSIEGAVSSTEGARAERAGAATVSTEGEAGDEGTRGFCATETSGRVAAGEG